MEETVIHITEQNELLGDKQALANNNTLNKP